MDKNEIIESYINSKIKFDINNPDAEITWMSPKSLVSMEYLYQLKKH